jgi:hypothetical protein
VRSKPVSLLETCTCAPGADACELSVTVPESVALELTWPKKVLQIDRNNRSANALLPKALSIAQPLLSQNAPETGGPMLAVECSNSLWVGSPFVNMFLLEKYCAKWAASRYSRLHVCYFFRSGFGEVAFIPGDRTVNPIHRMFYFANAVPFARVTHKNRIHAHVF